MNKWHSHFGNVHYSQAHPYVEKSSFLNTRNAAQLIGLSRNALCALCAAQKPLQSLFLMVIGRPVNTCKSFGPRPKTLLKVSMIIHAGPLQLWAFQSRVLSQLNTGREDSLV